MKKFLLSLLTVAATFGFASAATSQIDLALYGKTIWPNTQNYTTTNTSTDGEWKIINANNNNNGWTYVKFGPKNSTTTGSIQTVKPLAEAIESVDVNITAIANGSITAMTLVISDDATFDTNDTQVNATAPTSAGVVTFTVPSPAANKYYSIDITCKNTTKSNGVASVDKVSFIYTPAPLELGEIMVGEEIADNLTPTIYSGEKIKFTCDNATSISYTAENGNDYNKSDEVQGAEIEWEAPTVTTATEYMVSVTATDGSKTAEATLMVTVKPARATTSLTFASESLEHYATEFGAEVDGVALTVTPENAAVKYSSDKPEVVSVDETTGKLTINALGKAIITATVEGTETYSDASASYTVDVNPTTLAQLLSLAKDTPFTLKNGNMTVVYQKGNYLYIQDETAGIQVYQNSETYTVGSKFTELSGTYSLFNELPQVKESTIGGFTADEPVAVEPVIRSIDYVTADVMNQYVTVEDLTITKSGSNYTATDANGKTIALFNRFSLTMQTGEHITITGLTACFNTTLQIFPTEFTTYTSPVSIIEGENTLTGDIVLSGADRTVNFTYPGHIEVWYKWEPTATPESVRARVASVDDNGFTKHEGEDIVLSTSGTLSYYSVNNGVKSAVNTIGVSGSGTTSISEISAELNGAEVIYDLQGRRVNRAAKGIFIVNGKKELRK